MGGGLSAEEQYQYAAEFYLLAEAKPMLPDIGIDDSIVKFSGLDSASALDGYASHMLSELGSKGPGFIKDMHLALASFKFIPYGVGIGALMISFFLDVIISGLSVGSYNHMILGMMRRVFAEEKASSVRDAMDEYIKRFRYNMPNPEELLRDTKRMESQLSDGLTRLRNSMLRDNHMNSRSMKYWTNGAAFHLQMVIHIARLQIAYSSNADAELNKQMASVRNLADHYEDDVKELLNEYETYKRTTIYTDLTERRCVPGHMTTLCSSINCGVYDSELRSHVGARNTLAAPECKSITDTYRNFMFIVWDEPRKLKQYFREIKGNLRELILQRSTFDIEKYLPSSKKKK